MGNKKRCEKRNAGRKLKKRSEVEKWESEKDERREM